MLDPNDDTPTYDAAMTAVTTKIAAQEAMLSGLDPIDHDRAEVRRFRDGQGPSCPPPSTMPPEVETPRLGPR